MIRVVLDTNVLVSGTFWSGQSYQIINLIEKEKLIFVTSPAILEEYNAVMNYKEIKDKVDHHHERSQASLKLAQLGVLVYPTTNVKVVKEDPSDDKFIDAALAGKADYIVSQDKHLLKIKEHNGIKIITPEEFLETINRNK